MYQFFETIRYHNDTAENISLHQKRIDRTCFHFGVYNSLILQNIILESKNKPSSNNDVYKCRIRYSLNGEYLISYEKYILKTINNLSVADIDNRSYTFKSTDRDWLNDILNNAGTGEVILTQRGVVKDATYANLAFFDGQNWFTPTSPLLHGVRRAQLLEQGIIKEQKIQIKDLHLFKSVRLINSMMLWEESPVILRENIFIK